MSLNPDNEYNYRSNDNHKNLGENPTERKTLENAYILLNEKINKLHMLYNMSESLLFSMNNFDGGDNESVMNTGHDDNVQENKNIVNKFYETADKMDYWIAYVEKNINEVQKMIK